MAEDELQAREAVEHAAEQQTQRVRCGFHAPPPRRPGQLRMPGEHLRLHKGIGRMQVHRHVQRLHALPERVIGGIVVVAPMRMAVHQRALEAELQHGTFQLGCRLLGVLHRQRGKAGIARRMAGDLRRQEVIARARPCQRQAGVGFSLHARAGLRQHGDVDAAPVHPGQALFVEIGKAAAELGEHRGIDMLREPFGVSLEAGGHEMLFQGDLLHIAHAGGGS
ncbi:hypothetical protein D9M69_328950 [compost metagenome]